MNIFFLDLDMRKNAEQHLDAHVTKMCVEYAQMLSTACRISGLDVGYKIAYANHPCNIWVRQSIENWWLLRTLGIYLGEEHVYRFGTVHKSAELIKRLPLPNLPSSTITYPWRAMPEIYKEYSVIQSYRNYYIGEKQHIAYWTKRPVPEWFVKTGKNNEYMLKR